MFMRSVSQPITLFRYTLTVRSSKTQDSTEWNDDCCILLRLHLLSLAIALKFRDTKVNGWGRACIGISVRLEEQAQRKGEECGGGGEVGGSVSEWQQPSTYTWDIITYFLLTESESYHREEIGWLNFWVLEIIKGRIRFWNYLFDTYKSINHIRILSGRYNLNLENASVCCK
jgi:hypothetical protein